MTSGVYQITNKINGKFYIGSTKDFHKRWNEHRNFLNKEKPRYDSKLFYAWKKYGEMSFVFTIIEECEPIKKILLSREQHYIDSLCPEYNLQRIAGSCLGQVMSEESRSKKSIALTGKIKSEEHRKNLSIAAKSRPSRKHSLATRRKIGTSNIGRKLSANSRQKMGADKIGKKLSDETRRRMSDSTKLQYQNKIYQRQWMLVIE